MHYDALIQQVEPLLLSGDTAKVQQGKAILAASAAQLSSDDQQRLSAYIQAILPKVLAAFSTTE